VSSEHHHAEMPHEPAPPEPRFRVPPADQLVRGTGLAAAALGTAWLALAALRANWLLAPVAAGLGALGALSAWAAAIHLTGGEKFDDHPFV